MDLAERDAFLGNYRKLLGHIFDDIQADVQYYCVQNNTEITCNAGCTSCCREFVSVNVSHAVLVADYLNADKKAMAVFRNGFEKWLQAFEQNPGAAATLHKLEEHTSLAGALKPYPQELCVSYHKLNIPCPFLDRGQCSIRKVRPVACAAYFSISPVEDCLPDSPVQPLILAVKPAQEHLKHMAGLADPKLYQHQEPLPKLVNKILMQGLPEVELEIARLFGKGI